MKSFQVINVRPGGQYSLMACDLAIGYTDGEGNFVGQFQVNGLFLKQKKDGSGYYYDAPFKFREKNGVRVKDEKGYDRKDYHFDLFMEKGVGPTSEAHEARRTLIDEMVASWQAWKGESAGRGTTPAAKGPAKPKVAAKPAAAKTAVEAGAKGNPLEGDDDFDLF